MTAGKKMTCDNEFDCIDDVLDKVDSLLAFIKSEPLLHKHMKETSDFLTSYKLDFSTCHYGPEDSHRRRLSNLSVHSLKECLHLIKETNHLLEKVKSLIVKEDLTKRVINQFNKIEFKKRRNDFFKTLIEIREKVSGKNLDFDLPTTLNESEAHFIRLQGLSYELNRYNRPTNDALYSFLQTKIVMKWWETQEITKADKEHFFNDHKHLYDKCKSFHNKVGHLVKMSVGKYVPDSFGQLKYKILETYGVITGPVNCEYGVFHVPVYIDNESRHVNIHQLCLAD